MALDPKVFEISEVKASHPKVTHAKLLRVIFEGSNADIEYQEGYVIGDVFEVMGVNKIHLIDNPDSNDFSDFKTLLNNSEDIEMETITYLMGKLQL